MSRAIQVLLPIAFALLPLTSASSCGNSADSCTGKVTESDEVTFLQLQKIVLQGSTRADSKYAVAEAEEALASEEEEDNEEEPEAEGDEEREAEGGKEPEKDFEEGVVQLQTSNMEAEESGNLPEGKCGRNTKGGPLVCKLDGTYKSRHVGSRCPTNGGGRFRNVGNNNGHAKPLTRAQLTLHGKGRNLVEVTKDGDTYCTKKSYKMIRCELLGWPDDKKKYSRTGQDTGKVCMEPMTDPVTLHSVDGSNANEKRPAKGTWNPATTTTTTIAKEPKKKKLNRAQLKKLKKEKHKAKKNKGKL